MCETRGRVVKPPVVWYTTLLFYHQWQLTTLKLTKRLTIHVFIFKMMFYRQFPMNTSKKSVSNTYHTKPWWKTECKSTERRWPLQNCCQVWPSTWFLQCMLNYIHFHQHTHGYTTAISINKYCSRVQCSYIHSYIQYMAIHYSHDHQHKVIDDTSVIYIHQESEGIKDPAHLIDYTISVFINMYITHQLCPSALAWLRISYFY